MSLSPRLGAAYTLSKGLVLRGGWGIYVSPWNYPAAATTNWAQYGFSATTTLQQSSAGVPVTTLADPFPAGLVQPTGDSLGMLTNVGQATNVFMPDRGTSRAYQYSADLQKELPRGIMVGVGYTGLSGRNLPYLGSININQLDPKYQNAGINTLQSVPNPFFGVSQAGGFAARQTIELGQLLRPYPQFGDVLWQGATGARSQYHALILQGRRRTDNHWGVNVNYTFSRLMDNQVGQSNFYSASPGVQNNYVLVPWSTYFNPDAEYSRSLLDSPHKIVIAPTVNLPFGEGHKWAQTGVADMLLGGWSITAVATFQSGFPIGVSQNENAASFLFGGTLRPNVVSGAAFTVDGDITERIRTNTSDNLYLNRNAFTATPVNRYGNAPRILPGVLSPNRNNVDLSVSKNVGTGGRTSASVRLEVLNLLNQVQWAAPASTAFGNSNFAQITNQANNMRMVQFTFKFSF